MAGKAAVARACRLSHGRGPAHGEEDGHRHLTSAPVSACTKAAPPCVFDSRRSTHTKGARAIRLSVCLPEDDEGLVEKRRRLVRVGIPRPRGTWVDQLDARA